jgi:hypothetical protein
VKRLVLAALSWLAGCAPHDVSVAELPPPPDGGFHRRRPCVEDSDCTQPDYCDRDACGGVNGHCEHRPIFCDDPVRAPMCGCDGVTYWNDCLRRQAGVSAAPGECAETAAPCGGASAQPCAAAGASCARLSAKAECGGAAEGVCWMLPPSCPTDDGERFAGCDPAALDCVGACAAIRSEKPHYALPTGACP